VSNNVLYDHPGPRARRRNLILTILFGIGLAALLYYIYVRFDRNDQWAAERWRPFLEADIWIDFLLPGLGNTLRAAFTAMVLSLVFGLVFATARLSDHRWIRWPAGAVVEFFRAVPLLLLIFFIFIGMPFVFRNLEQPGWVPDWLWPNWIYESIPAFWAVVLGLTLYNGSVLAEAFRAGIRAVPLGQSEAAYALGMRKYQVMTLILIPQAARSMLPVIVSQLVVLLKDTALGYIIAYPELLQQTRIINATYGNVLQTVIVVAIIFIVINSLLTWFAHWVERRTQRGGKAPSALTGADEEIATEGTLPVTPHRADVGGGA